MFLSEAVIGIWPKRLGSAALVALIWGSIDTLILTLPVFLAGTEASIGVSTRLIIYVSIILGYSIAEPSIVADAFILSRLMAFSLTIALLSLLPSPVSFLTSEGQIVFYTIQLIGAFFFGVVFCLTTSFLGNWLAHSLHGVRISKKTKRILSVYKIVFAAITLFILLLGVETIESLVVPEGIEAGGNIRGRIGLIALLDQVLSSTDIPMIAAD